MSSPAISAGEAGRAAHARYFPSRTSTSSAWMIAYAYAAIAFFSGALERPLSGNPSSYVGTGESPIVQIAGGLVILIGGMITGLRLLYRPKTQALRLTTIGLALGLLCAWVLMSIGWSDNPAISFRRGVAFVGTILVSWTLAVYIPRDEMFRILGRAAIIFIAFSAVLGIGSHGYAFHQAGEAGNIEHVGRMRGSFVHKNEFARTLALALLLTLAFGRQAFHSKWPRFAALATGAFMLALAGSAKVMVAVPIAILAAIGINLCKTTTQRVGSLIFVGLPALFLMWSGYLDVLLPQMFSALGRDPTMSGRDVIWAAAQHSIAEHWLVGQGYAAGWAAQAQFEMQLLENKSEVMTHAHNGYLQTLLDIGVVGLTLSLIPLLYIIYDTILFRHRSEKSLDHIAVYFGSIFIILNITGSYLTNHNDIFTLMLVCIAIWVSQRRRDSRLALKQRQMGGAMRNANSFY
jgi:exopolysaccharide production protein ExoQ